MGAMNQRMPLTGISPDPVTAYAQTVTRAAIIAGPHVRKACERHLCDLQHGAERGLLWDSALAERAIGFYRDVLRLNGGDFEGVPYELLPWQAFIVGSLFGWLRDDGYRRFSVAYIETGKGSGKSPLAAGIGLYGLVADAENRAEIYAAATKKDQAQILFRDAVAMYDQSPELQWRLQASGAKGREWNLAYHATNSFFRTVSSDDGQSGPRPHIGILDEIHEHKDASAVEMMRAGVKGRRQPLIVMITNSGASRHSVCWEYHDYGTKVAARMLEDDSFFAYICALDEGDEPFKDSGCWIKANPSLGITIQKKYLEEQIRQARGIPSKESLVKRLNFCQWTESASPWISAHVWQSAREDIGWDELRGRRCYAGLDLSSVHDLTALVLAFEPTLEDPCTRVLPIFWLPEEGLAEKSEHDRVPYPAWVAAGHLRTTPGRAIDKAFVAAELARIAEQFGVVSVAYDRWRIEDLKQIIAHDGISIPELMPFGQGYKDMAPALDEVERRLLNGTLKHAGNPVLTWCAANAVTVSDPAGNRKLSKDKATGRIDGMVALVMAIGASMVGQDDTAAFNDYLGSLAN